MVTAFDGRISGTSILRNLSAKSVLLPLILTVGTLLLRKLRLSRMLPTVVSIEPARCFFIIPCVGLNNQRPAMDGVSHRPVHMGSIVAIAVSRPMNMVASSVRYRRLVGL